MLHDLQTEPVLWDDWTKSDWKYHLRVCSILIFPFLGRRFLLRPNKNHIRGLDFVFRWFPSRQYRWTEHFPFLWNGGTFEFHKGITDRSGESFPYCWTTVQAWFEVNMMIYPREIGILILLEYFHDKFMDFLPLQKSPGFPPSSCNRGNLWDWVEQG